MRRYVSLLLIMCLFLICGSYAYSSEGKKADSQPKMIQVKIHVDVKYPDKYKARCKDISRSLIVTTVENFEAKIDSKGFVESSRDSGRLVSNSTMINVLPNIGKSGNINITGNFTQDGEFFSVKNAKFAASFEPGKQKKLPAIVVPANKGKAKAAAELTITAVVVPN